MNQAFVQEIDFQELETKATFISTPRLLVGMHVKHHIRFPPETLLILDYEDYSNLIRLCYR